MEDDYIRRRLTIEKLVRRRQKTELQRQNAEANLVDSSAWHRSLLVAEAILETDGDYIGVNVVQLEATPVSD